ncbi:MAG TPA: NifB/NifX family molybdenum-iron cluster-binding protein [Methanobacterium sp.]
MSFKVAVASNDGKYVNQHFGKAQKFLIFEIDDGGEYKFLELRETPPRCGGSDDVKNKTLEMISDCEILLTTQIGPGARNKLLAQGTRPVIKPIFIEDALKDISALMNNE